jgi:predicted metalloprotease
MVLFQVQLALSVATQPLILRFTVLQIKSIYGLHFFEELKTRFGAQGGEFRYAYVIHTMGHHVQTLLGTSSKMRQMQQGKSKAEANKLSVALGFKPILCGVWFVKKHERLLEDGDIEDKCLMVLLATTLFNLKCKDILF